MKCPTCGQEIRSKRSVVISTHFHAHVTQIARETGQARDYVYMRCLLLACEIVVDGRGPYSYTIVDDVLYPHRTSACSNKQMMTAVEACHMYAAEAGIFLNEKPEEW